MDAFERVVSQILNHQGYWTRTEFKVDLTHQDKARIGRPNSPRWELDVLGYKPSRNEVLVVECKSFLDSAGIHINHFDPDNERSKRFKLFVETKTRKVIFQRLSSQLVKLGLCKPNPTIILVLAASKIAKNQQNEVSKFFRRKGFQLLAPGWLRDRLVELSTSGYDNEIASVVAKMIVRDRVE